MFNPLAYSVYIQSFETQRAHLETLDASKHMIFLSLHIREEFSPVYCERAEAVCHWLSEQGFYIIADVSKKTLTQFAEPDLFRLRARLKLSALRIDYGFTDAEIIALAKQLPLVLNASTVDPFWATQQLGKGLNFTLMHNFYPRPETGLDDETLQALTKAWQNIGVKVFAFIPGDLAKRGPIFAGLPSLERHRTLPPSVAFADLRINYHMDAVFLADLTLSATEEARINTFLEEDILPIPADLDEDFHRLYGQVFTCRSDSPARMIRLMESREYSCSGRTIPARNCLARPRGSITIDNENYARYSGELQILRADFSADTRVNVIGQIKEAYLPLVDCVKNKKRFMLVKD